MSIIQKKAMNSIKKLKKLIKGSFIKNRNRSTP